jgi:hypothetical protein
VIRSDSLSAVGDDVPVGQLAAGVELLRGGTWDLAASLQVAQGTKTKANGDTRTGRSTGLGVFFTWYAAQ